MGSLLAALTTIIVTVLAAFLAVPHFVDWNTYKPQVEEQIAGLVGREVRILGDVDLRVLPVPRLTMRGLRIADEFGKFEQPFAEAEGFNAILSIPPLIAGVVEARSISLDQPIVRLKIDEFNEGTWLSVGPYDAKFPLPINDIVLNDVTIRNGAIELRRARQSQSARFDSISGTFSSKSIAGPFRFDGSAIIGGATKTIQLSTAKVPNQNALRMKAALRSEDGVSLYQLDGEILGLDGPIHYSGPVAARLALDSEAKQAEADQIAEPLAGKAIELRSQAKITLEDATLDDITLTVTQNDRPQSVRGKAYASWKDSPRLDLDLESSWLDIDQMMRSSPEEDRPLPATAIAALPQILEGWTFKPRQGHISARIEQAGFAGDLVNDLRFVASHNREGWQIEKLTAKLPGETSFDASGAVPAGDTLNFNGNVTFNGENLSRLLRWAAPSLGVVDTGNAESFSLSTGLTLSATQLAFQGARGSLGESSFTGDLIHDYGDTSQLLLTLDSETLDLRGLYDPIRGAPATPGEVDISELLENEKDQPPGWGAQVVPSQKTSLVNVLQTVFKAEKSNVRLTIATLRLPDFQARDLRTEFRYENGTFDISELNVATTDGLKVEASGRMTGFETKPDGSLKLTVDAPSAQSVTNLARFAGLDSVSSSARSRIEALSPFTLRGNLNARASESIVRLTLAGSAGGSELTINGSLSGNLDQLDDAKVVVEGGMGNSDSRRLIAQLAPEVPAVRAPSQQGDGYLAVSAKGTMKTGLTSQIQLRTPQARGSFDGRISLLAEPSWGFDGLLDMRATQAATALSMLRVSPGGTPVTGAIDLRAFIKKDASQFRISDLTLQIGGETIKGSVEAELSGDKPSGTIDIEAASVSLPKIMAYLVDWDRRDLTSEIAGLSADGQGVWPNQAFSLRSLRSVDGTLTLKAPSFTMTDQIRLKGGLLKASLKSGALTLSELTGDVYGGKFKASGALTALKGRVGADLNIDVKAVDLAAIGKAHGGAQVVAGSADMTLSATSEGLSPNGLVSMLQGSGELSLTTGTLQGLSHTALKDAASTYLSQEIPSKTDLVSTLQNDFLAGSHEFDAVKVPVKLKDGVLRIANAEFAANDGQADANVIIDLSSMRFDSEWVVSTSEKIDGSEALPPVRLVFAGPVARFSEIKPQLNADGFERFLTIRRMDQDMERLEKLQEQRRLEEARQAAPREAAPPPAVTQENTDISAAPSEEPLSGDRDETVPEQSLLRAPPVTLDNSAASNPAPAEPSASASPDSGTVTGWSTGVESTGEQPAQPEQDWNTEPLPSVPNTSTFEDEIRKVLREQEQSRNYQ